MQTNSNTCPENLDTLSFDQLKSLFQEHYDKPPPKSASHAFLIANIAYKAQQIESGGLSLKSKNKLSKIAQELEKDPAYQIILKQDIRAGTRLIREWHDEIHEVTVLDEGFEYRGQRHRSLSKIAFEITGTKWSGPVFFGLKK
jgi:hypothetical protein